MSWWLVPDILGDQPAPRRRGHTCSRHAIMCTAADPTRTEVESRAARHQPGPAPAGEPVVRRGADGKLATGARPASVHDSLAALGILADSPFPCQQLVKVRTQRRPPLAVQPGAGGDDHMEGHPQSVLPGCRTRILERGSPAARRREQASSAARRARRRSRGKAPPGRLECRYRLRRRLATRRWTVRRQGGSHFRDRSGRWHPRWVLGRAARARSASRPAPVAARREPAARSTRRATTPSRGVGRQPRIRSASKLVGQFGQAGQFWSKLGDRTPATSRDGMCDDEDGLLGAASRDSGAQTLGKSLCALFAGSGWTQDVTAEHDVQQGICDAKALDAFRAQTASLSGWPARSSTPRSTLCVLAADLSSDLDATSSATTKRLLTSPTPITPARTRITSPRPRTMRVRRHGLPAHPA